MTRLAWLLVVGLLLCGCCRPLVLSYERDQVACLERFSSPEQIESGVDLACVMAVRAAYRPMLEEAGCD